MTHCVLSSFTPFILYTYFWFLVTTWRIWHLLMLKKVFPTYPTMLSYFASLTIGNFCYCLRLLNFRFSYCLWILRWSPTFLIFMYIMKSTGPTTDPCGTLLHWGRSIDDDKLSFFLLLSQFLIQLCTLSSILSCLVLNIN